MALHGGGSERSDSALDTLYAHDIAFAGAAPHYADSLAAPSPRNDLRSALAAAASPAAADVFMTGTLQSPPAGASHKSHAGVRAATPPPGAARAGAGAAEQRLGALLSCGPGEGPTLKQKVAAQRGCTSEGAVRRVKAPRARHPATSAAGPQRGSEGDAEGCGLETIVPCACVARLRSDCQEFEANVCAHSPGDKSSFSACTTMPGHAHTRHAAAQQSCSRCAAHRRAVPNAASSCTAAGCRMLSARRSSAARAPRTARQTRPCVPRRAELQRRGWLPG